jgi:SAM-dependent methyltransferase
MPFAAAVFDTVLCTQMLDDMPEQPTFFRALHDLLVPGGHLILTAAQWWRIHDAPHDYYRHTRYGLQYLAEQAGLVVDWIKPRGGYWTVTGQRFSDYLVYRWGPRTRAAELLTAASCAVTQAVCARLDRAEPVHLDTLGYTMVAHRPHLNTEDA